MPQLVRLCYQLRTLNLQPSTINTQPSTKSHRWRWILGAVAVVVPLGYFSWTADPAMVRIEWLPGWLARWADDFPILRTGAALVPAGGLLGAWLVRHRRPCRDWFLGGLVLVLLVAIAELGQLLQPRRVCDAKDFLAGSGGAVAGMLLASLLGRSLARWRQSRAVSPPAEGGG